MSTAKIQKLLLLVSKSSEISTLRRTSATLVSSAHPSATSIPASPALSNRHPRVRSRLLSTPLFCKNYGLIQHKSHCLLSPSSPIHKERELGTSVTCTLIYRHFLIDSCRQSIVDLWSSLRRVRHQKGLRRKARYSKHIKPESLHQVLLREHSHRRKIRRDDDYGRPSGRSRCRRIVLHNASQEAYNSPTKPFPSRLSWGDFSYIMMIFITILR